MKGLHRTIFLLSLALVLITSCTATPQTASTVPQESSPTVEAVAATEAQLPTTGPTDTLAPTPTHTDTPLPTFTLTPEATSTLALSPTPNMVMPGYYGGGGCVTKHPFSYDGKASGWYWDWCVIYVHVTRNRHMVFLVTWVVHNWQDRYRSVMKNNLENFKGLYLVDNLGNHYGHIGGGGTSYQEVKVSDDYIYSGTFEFTPPPEGAFMFDFHSDGDELVIEDIRLQEQIFVYREYETPDQKYYLTYRDAAWVSANDEAGDPFLTNKDIPNCTIKNHPVGDLQGRLKDKKVLGKIAYDIFGFIDPVTNLGVREYVPTGLKDVDPSDQPRYWATIPLDNQQSCVLGISEVLATLEKIAQ